MNALNDRFAPLLGEFVWHSLTKDPTLDAVSARHLQAVEGVLARHGRHLPASLQLLEVAAYAHTTGYSLARQPGTRATLLDISASALKLGRRSARRDGLPLDGTRLVAADFHQLPFEDAQFHLVYICSALHHTVRWTEVLAELVRVLAPGGLLFLENEPCLREFCFYRFRANREKSFTPFEKALDALGAIRTVAEPYVGSRPEQLFGMTENQQIPLEELRQAVERECRTVEFNVHPGPCVGILEHQLLRQHAMEAGKLESWLASHLEQICAQAAPALGETEKGLGFSLPTRAQIVELSRKIVPAVKALPVIRAPRLRRFLGRLTHAPGRFLPRGHREGLARLFGAGVNIVAIKRGMPGAAVSGRLKDAFPEEEEVVLGFEPEIRRLLARRDAAFPDLQAAPQEAIQHVFPASDWEFKISAEGIRSVASRLPSARILAPVTAGSLVLLRVYAARLDRPYRVGLFLGDAELAGMDVYQTESFLLSAIAARSNSLHIRITPLGTPGGALPQSLIALSYAGAIAP